MSDSVQVNAPAQVRSSRSGIADNTGHQQNIQEGSGSGSGFGGSLASTALSIGYDIFKTAQQNKQNKQMYARQVADNRENAAVAFERQKALMDKAEQYNSYQNKVSMLRQAGLNPALAFGDLGSSVAAGSADQAAPGSYHAANAPDANLLAQLPEKISIAEDIRQKEITNKYLDFKSSQEIFKMIAETNKMIADTSLTDEQRNNLLAFRDEQLNLLRAQTKSNTAAAEQSAATAAYTSGTLTDVGKSQIPVNESVAKLNDEKAKTEPFQRSNLAANTALAKTHKETEENYTRGEILSRKELNEWSKNLTQEEVEKLVRENGLAKAQRNMIHSWCLEHGYDEGVEQMIGIAFQTAGSEVPKNLAEFLNGGHWIRFVSDMVKAFKWSSPGDDEIGKKKSGSIETPTTGKPSESPTPIGGSVSNTPSPYLPDGVREFPYAHMQSMIKKWYDERIDRPNGWSVDFYNKRKKEVDDLLQELNSISVPDSERNHLLQDVERIFKTDNDRAIEDLRDFIGWLKDVYKKE